MLYTELTTDQKFVPKMTIQQNKFQRFLHSVTFHQTLFQLIVVYVFFSVTQTFRKFNKLTKTTHR